MRGRGRGRWAVGGLLALALAGGSAGTAAAQLATGNVAFDGAVGVTLQAGGYTYVGGVFDRQLAPTGSGFIAAAPAGDGALVPGGVPAVTGAVYASAPDGAGGLFLGGSFTQVGGVARRNLAHVTAAGTVDPTWNPSADATVARLDRVGTRLVAAGAFTTVGGRTLPTPVSESGSVAVLATTGTGAASAFAAGVEGDITGLDASGTRVYLAGDLLVSGTDTRLPAAALDLATGALLPWRADPDATPADGGPADAITVVGDTVVLGILRSFYDNGHDLLGLDAATGRRKWTDGTPMFSPRFAVDGARLYVVPSLFNTNDGIRPYALDPATGERVWEAHTTLIRDTFSKIAGAALVSDGALYVTGVFDEADDGADRNSTAAFDTTTGLVLPWNPRLTSPGGATLDLYRGQVAIGGGFTGAGADIGAVTDIARLLPDGSLDTSFAPVDLGPLFSASGFPNQSVVAMAIDGDTLYFGGDFWTANTLRRGGLAAIDLTTGKLSTSFAPNNLNLRISGIKVVGDLVEVQSDTTDATVQFTRRGGEVVRDDDPEFALAELLRNLDYPSEDSLPGALAAPEAGTLEVVATVDGTDYVVASGTDTAQAAGDVLSVQLDLEVAGRFIRSVYPGYGFRYKATFTPADGGPAVVADQFEARF